MQPLTKHDAFSSGQTSTSSPGEPLETRLHKRSIVIGLFLVVAVSYVSLYVDLVVKQMQTGVLQFASGAVGAFFIVYAVTRLGRKVGLLKWMNAADLLIMYVMMFVGVFVCTRGLLEKMLPAVAYVNSYSSPTNYYRALIFPHLNPALVVGDPRGPANQAASSDYFNGLGADKLPWDAWLVPCASWFILFALVVVAFLCLSTLLRRQWTDVERLSFPLTILPLQIFDDNAATALFKNQLTWLGIAIPFAIYGINGLHQAVPSIPQIPLQFENIQQPLNMPPWDQIQGTSIYLSFAAIGFAYLLPTDLLFSLWFFFILTRIGDVIARAWNLEPVMMLSYPTRAYLGFQAAGAYVALAMIFMYAGRHVYIKTLQDAFRFRISEEDKVEMMPRRIALWGLLACYAGIVAWSIWAGMSLWFAAAVWLIYLFVTSLVLTRGVAEAGFLMTETSFRPGDVVGMFVSKASLGGGNVVALSLLNATFFRDMRGLFLALFMDVQQMAGGVKMRRRNLILPIGLAVVVAFIVGVATHLQLSYAHGATALYNYGVANAGWAFDDADATLRHAQKPFPSAPAWFAVGFVVVLALSKLRSMFVGFPLNPIGYALAPTWTMIVIWFPVLLVWITKTFVLRYGSGKAYRQFMPFFLGLIIGEFGSAALWAILASVFKVMAPQLPLP
ncbi:MAG: hypothetical protein P4L33_22710 [Capsulimonadaceae bacterium]|nr:hypothetical protein [Capsulimonadaceae bacterium]